VSSLITTLVVSLPAFWNVGALLGLLFFIYAYMSVLLFGEVEYNKGLDYQANFSNFALALLTLFRCARARARADERSAVHRRERIGRAGRAASLPFACVRPPCLAT